MSAGILCEIEGTNEDCSEYARRIVSADQCSVAVKFKYTFTKTSLGCVDIDFAKGLAGPLGLEYIAFEDEVSCSDRRLCQGDTWSVPDRRFVNLCEMTMGDWNPWDLRLDIQDKFGRSQSLPGTYTWPIITLTPPSAPTPTAPTAPTPTPPTGTGKICTGRPSKMKFSIKPIGCDESKNSFLRRLKHNSGSDKSYFSCEGNKPPSFPVNFTVYSQKYNNYITSGTAYSPEDVFYFSPVPSNVMIKMTSDSCDQTATFHSSCSKPLYTGDKFGSVTLVDFVY